MSKKWLIISSVSFGIGLGLNLIISKNIKQAALTGLLSVPATTASVLVTEHQRKKRLNDRIKELNLEKQRSRHELDTLQNNKLNLERKIEAIENKYQQLQQQETELPSFIAQLSERVENLKQQEQEIQTTIKELNLEKQRSQQEFDTLNNNKSNLQREIKTIESKHQQLQQQKLELEASIQSDSDNYNQLQKQINKQENQKYQLEEILWKLRVEEVELGKSKSQLKVEVENLKQQEKDIQTTLERLNSDKQRSQQEIDALKKQINYHNNHKSNLERAIEAIKDRYQQFQQQEIELETKIKSDRDTYDRLQQQKSDVETDLKQIEKHRKKLQQQIDNQENQKYQLDRELSSSRVEKLELRYSKAKLESKIRQLQQQKLELERQFKELQQQLKEEVENLQNNVNLLENQKRTVEQELAEVETNKQQVTDSLIEQQQRRNSIQEEINEREYHSQELEEELSDLNTQLSKLQSLIDELESEIEQLNKQKDKLQSDLVNPEFEELQIEFDFDELEEASQTEDIVIQKLYVQPLIEPGIKQDNLKQESQNSNQTNNDNQKERDQENILVKIDDDIYHLKTRESIKNLWENIILPQWRHKDYPAGYRFLGNIDIQKEESDRIIKAVGEKIKRLNPLTDQLEENLRNIITFALSEYAYYYSEKNKGFWEGFYEHIETKCDEKVLRKIIEKSIDLLKLIKPQGGYKYVSALWLQSGVPKKNMRHFADIVNDVADEYGWWEISHSSPEDIAEALWQCLEKKYSHYGTIKHFLKLDNSNEDIEPISGQLVKNIAIVARELEDRKIASEQLQNQNIREEILENGNLSYGFFLRDWSDLIKVLTPRKSKSDRSLTKRGNQLPYLYLDSDTLNILLILPEQSLWKNEWRDLRGTYCQISEANWEDDIPSQGNLEISELEITVTQAVEKWSCQLQNHHQNLIYQWEHEGINSEFPCLVFDAISGEHIKIDISEPNIIGIEEIIVFTPKEIEIQLDNNIEEIDRFVPSSISGWRGKEIRLLESEASIQIQDVTITWKLQEQKQPRLIGLTMKGRKLVYLNTPSLYYPPQKQNITINCLIESIDKKETIARNCLSLSTDNNWIEIDLSQCIKEQGNYQATFWHQEKSWSYRFEVREEYQITQQIADRNFKIYNCDNNRLSRTAKYDNIDRFWAEEIKIDNLYPFEELTFRLKSDYEKYIFQKQADSLGKLNLSLASLYDYLSPSDRYSLGVKQSGSKFKRILQVGYFITWKLTATEVIFEGLSLENNYYLSGWNLLNPNKKPEKINFSTLNLDKVTINISFSPGIYSIQLYQEQQLVENIGLWCNIAPENIPNEIKNDDNLANYCYTILDNESLEDFSNALKQIGSNFDKEKIQTLIVHLHQEKYYLPEWLNKDSLNQKIQKIL